MSNGQRKLNKRFVAILTIAAMLLSTVVIALVMYANAQRDPQLFADRAEALSADGQYTKAASAYLKAHRYDDKNPKWLIPLSECYFQLGEYDRALGWLQKAVMIDEGFIEAQEKLVRMCYRLWGRTSRPGVMKVLHDHADKLIEMVQLAPEDQDSPEYRKVLALGYHCRGLGYPHR